MKDATYGEADGDGVVHARADRDDVAPHRVDVVVRLAPRRAHHAERVLHSIRPW